MHCRRGMGYRSCPWRSASGGAAERPNRGDLDVHLVRNIARPLLVAAHREHREEILLLSRGQPIEAHAKKTLVELGNCFNRGFFDVQSRNRRGFNSSSFKS